MKLSLPPKLVEKLVWVPVFSFCKISLLWKNEMPAGFQKNEMNNLLQAFGFFVNKNIKLKII